MAVPMSAESSSLTAVLQKHFGFSEFRLGQEPVIEALLEGRSALAVFPTGAGKSMCYQLPAILLDGLTLVISPLIALMEDQVGALKKRGVAAERLDSTRSYDEIREIYARVQSGEVKLLYVAPERLANEGFLRFLQTVSIALLAIDEAHCLSEWGHNFRPDYLKLPRFSRDFQVGRVLCLTATATPDVSADIRSAFGIAEEDHIQTSFRRPNLNLHVSPCEGGAKKALLLDRLGPRAGSSSIVYVTRQETAENVATYLAREGLSARAYHAGLAPEVRTEVQESFMQGAVDTVVATIAFGMGIDKPDIRAVFHFNLPKSIENYVQEIGRAGRDGEASHCEMLACEDDRIVLENFIFGDTPSAQAIANALDHLLRQGESFAISRYELSQACDMRPTVLATLLTYLEIDEVIRQTGPFYAGYRIELLLPIDRILAGHTSKRQDFIRTLLASGKPGRKWLAIDVEEAARATGSERSKVVEAIGWMEQHGDIHTQPNGLRHGYQLGEGISPSKALGIARKLQELFVRREDLDVSRVAKVIAFAQNKTCFASALVSYFGEDKGEPCETCTACTDSQHPISLPRSTPEELDAGALSIISEMTGMSLVQLRTPRQLARFLCGITSPAASRARLQRHDHFAALAQYPFQLVLEAVELQGG